MLTDCKKTIYTASKRKPATRSSNISFGLSLLKEGSEEGTSLNMDECPEKTEEKATNTVERADN